MSTNSPDTLASYQSAVTHARDAFVALARSFDFETDADGDITLVSIGGSWSKGHPLFVSQRDVMLVLDGRPWRMEPGHGGASILCIDCLSSREKRMVVESTQRSDGHGRVAFAAEEPDTGAMHIVVLCVDTQEK